MLTPPKLIELLEAFRPGDMFTGAMIALGVRVVHIEAELKKVHLSGTESFRHTVLDKNPALFTHHLCRFF